MQKNYDHQLCEDQIYQLWEKFGLFNPDENQSLRTPAPNSLSTSRPKAQKPRPFTIIMPPPNANDPLHVGHAMFVTLEDIVIRFKRMQGFDALWLPGTDHAGIETQFVFEKKLQKKNQSRFDFDRETLFQMIWDYVQKNSDVAINQMKKLGASADWSRYKFTLDEDVVKTVLDTFLKLRQKGLVYRANFLVNYCTKCGTGFSELEINHQEQVAPLYYIKYGPLTIATTRPETKFADIALAVHPDDKRYQQYHNSVLEVPCLFATYQLPVIADEFVDPEFGTGVVKITPLHDKNDFRFWQKHQNHPLINNITPEQAIDFDGRLTKLAGPYKGLTVFSGRKQVVADLEANNLIEKIDEKHHNSVAVCYRCNRAIEPLPLPQFYIKTKPLVEPVLKALDNNEIVVHGAGHDKILKHWLEILEDWNISRQIVWGIRLPVWYDSKENPDISVTFIDENRAQHSGSLGELVSKHSLETIKAGLQSLRAPDTANYEISLQAPSPYHIQETDTFDTWFSSSQWPVATLQNTKQGDFERFFPTQLMETGYDILMFWVMRMLIMGKFVTNQLPFDTVYLHGLIRDAKGLKMSKSKGNAVDPMEVAQKYGADALRMALVTRSSAGLDKNVSESDFKAARNLTNKLWNAVRFVLLMAEESGNETCVVRASSTNKLDDKFDQQLIKVAEDITKQLERYQLGLAANSLHNYFWHWFCDESIEKCKNGEVSIKRLLGGLQVFLKLFHPFMPFVTEQLWQVLLEKKLVSGVLLAMERWPNKTT